MDACSSVEFICSSSSKFDGTDRGTGDGFLRGETSLLRRLGRSWSSLFSFSLLTSFRLRDEDRGAGIGGSNVFSVAVLDLVFLLFDFSFSGFSDAFR
jgi:hypothetical protein